MSVIELGDVSPGPGPPGPPLLGPEFDPRSRRRLTAAGVVLLCALLLGASGRPGTPTVHQVWSTTATGQDALTLRTDGLFLHRTVDGHSEITAYDLATGVPRWRRGAESQASWMYQGEEAGLLLIPGDEQLIDIKFEDGSRGQMSYGGTTTALDASTGRPLWRIPGETHFVTAGTVLLAERNSSGELATIRLVDAHTGAGRWTRKVPGVRHLAVQGEGAGPPRIVVADDSGDAMSLRYADGSVLAERRLPWSRAEPDHGIDTFLYLADGVLLVSRNDPAEGSVTAFDAESLTRLWTRDTPPWAGLQYCGPVLCLAEATTMHGVDVRTGRSLWTLPGRGGAQFLTDDRVLLAGESGDPPEQVLVNPATGEQIGTGTQGWPLRDDPGTGRIVMLHRILAVGTLQSRVSHLDLATGKLTLVGVVEAAEQPGGDQCDAVAGYLACRRDQRLVVTVVG